MEEGTLLRSVPERHHLHLLVLLYSRFILLLSLFYTNHKVSIFLFSYDYLNSTAILLCLCFYSLYYHFVNWNFICSNNNLYIDLLFHFTYDTDEEITDEKIIFVNNFKRRDSGIDLPLRSHLQMVFGYIHTYIHTYIYIYEYVYYIYNTYIYKIYIKIEAIKTIKKICPFEKCVFITYLCVMCVCVCVCIYACF